MYVSDSSRGVGPEDAVYPSVSQCPKSLDLPCLAGMSTEGGWLDVGPPIACPPPKLLPSAGDVLDLVRSGRLDAGVPTTLLLIK